MKHPASDKTIREIILRLARLEKAVFKPRPSKDAQKADRDSGGKSPVFDFDTSERAFVKSHGQNLSGPKKFVLLLAYLTKGKAGEEIPLKYVEKHWNKMTASNLLDGKFNRFYSNSAKESGWVNTKKQGVYFLRPSWQDIFK